MRNHISNDFLGFEKYDLILLSMSSVFTSSDSILKGEDVGVLLKNKVPNARLIIFSSCSDAISMYDMIKKVVPDGFLTTFNLSFEEFETACNNVINGIRYVSPLISKKIKQLSGIEVLLKKHNRIILQCLARGVKTKDIPKHLPLSLSAIEKRKAKLKTVLCNKSTSDMDLLSEAKRRGLI
ncbi:hypothetical protein [Ascidiimonas aurantiaca]|uniref:hypothetical protein n=1 Tax=Ascidiimonas aurantiaca TaxID=1685432 RepID=UPI0030EC00FF